MHRRKSVGCTRARRHVRHRRTKSKGRRRRGGSFKGVGFFDSLKSIGKTALKTAGHHLVQTAVKHGSKVAGKYLGPQGKHLAKALGKAGHMAIAGAGMRRRRRHR